MVEFILAVFLYSKFKMKYNLTPLFKHWSIYPPMLMMLVYVVAEIMIFNDNYYMVQHGSLIKQLTLLSYLPLVLQFKLYDSCNTNKSEIIRFITSPFCIGIICLIIGYSLNYIAITANSGHMPVYPSNTYFTGYTDISSFTNDSFYILGDHTSKAIPLTDTIDIFISNLSIGDLFCRIFVYIILYYSIKKSNKI